MKKKTLFFQVLSFALALLLALPLCAAEVEGESARYILLLDGSCSAKAFAAELADESCEILYVYDRLICGLCISTTQSRESLAAREGVTAVLTPQIYTMTENESSPSGLLDEKEIEADSRLAEAAIEHAEEADGSGTVVALLDAGFDTKLDCLTLGNPAKAKLTESALLSLRGSLSADLRAFSYWREVWGGYKVPFAYDYAEGDCDVSATDNTHGNHTAAIIAANGERKGAAPEAQLLLMKVAVSLYGKQYAEEGAVLAALEDSVTLGADVICLPFGSPQITGNAYASGYALSLALDAANNAGATVVVAAGNDGERAEAAADSPDNTTLHGIASHPAVLTVGSADYFMQNVPCLVCEDGFRFRFTDTGENVSGISFTEAFDGKSLEIVAVPGDGTPEDFAELALEGKIALIRRGTIPFADKVNHAEAAGALGVIVYNNEPNAALVNMQLDPGSIPAVFVSMETGEMLVGRTLTVSSEDFMQIEVEGGGLVSDFSSRGIGKPDLVAFGACLTPPDAESAYDTVEGTSYAAALAAGYAASLLSYRQASGDNPTPEELRTTLINSAETLDVSDTPLSTRAQGAGRLSLTAAMQNTAALTTEDGGASLSLGNIEEETSHTFTLTLTNNSESSRSFDITASPTTAKLYSYCYNDETGILYQSEESDGSYPYYVSDRQQPLPEVSLRLCDVELNRFAENHTPYRLTLAPGEKTELTFTLDLSALTLHEAYQKGCFLEGFIEVAEQANAAEDGVTADFDVEVTLPFCGFVGKREAISPVGSITLTSYSANRYLFGEWELGTNAFEESAIDKAAFSPNRDGSYETVILRMELLRDIDRFAYEILTEDGESILTSPDYTNLYNASAGGFFTLEVWDGSDPENARYVYPDGDYILRLFFYDGDECHILDRSLTIDCQKPTVEATLDGDSLSCRFGDKIGIQYVCVYAIDKSGLFQSFYTAYIPPSEDCCDFIHTFDLGACGDCDFFYIEVCDYAFNRFTQRISTDRGVS